MNFVTTLAALLLSQQLLCTNAWTVTPLHNRAVATKSTFTLLQMSSEGSDGDNSDKIAAAVEKIKDASAAQVLAATSDTSNIDTTSIADNAEEQDVRNPDRPELPALKNDFDWDSKFEKDDDWTSDADNIPGKMVINQVDLVKQATELDKLEEKWRKERLQKEYDGAAQIGFVGKAEILNGRTAMFFLVTGLLTEYWTGISMPGQVEEMLRIAGVIGFDT